MSKKILLFLFCIASIGMYAQVKPLPALQVAGDGRSLQTADGKPFFWQGDTGWLLFVKLKREEVIQYLDTRKAQGFNVVQVMVIHDIRHAVNKYGDSAFHHHNGSMPATTPGNSTSDAAQYDFWDHIDFVVAEAARRGIYLAMVPIWGSNVKGGNMNRSAAKVYASFLANRYKTSSNIVWLNGGDIPGSDSIAVWNTIGSTLKQLDPGHLVSFHPRGRTTSSRWFHNEPWLDFNMFQSGHRTYAQDTSAHESNYGEDNWKYVAEDFEKKPLKPTLDGEPSYEGIPKGLHDTTQPYWSSRDVRRYAYWSVLAGSAGFTYGNSAIMQFFQPGDRGSSYGAKEYWRQAITDTGARQMIYLKKLVTSYPWFQRVPDQSLTTNSGDQYERLAGMRGKKFAFIYSYTGRTMQVQLGKIEGKRVKARWYDPRKGTYSNIGTYNNSGTREFDAPGTEADGNDWVLVLDGIN